MLQKLKILLLEKKKYVQSLKLRSLSFEETSLLNSFALRMAKTVESFGHSGAKELKDMNHKTS